MTPQDFNVIAVGAGAIVVALVALGSAIANYFSNQKIITHTQEIKVSMDGRMDQLLETTRQIAVSAGIKIGLKQAIDESAAAREAVRTDAIADAQAQAKVREAGQQSEASPSPAK